MVAERGELVLRGLEQRQRARVVLAQDPWPGHRQVDARHVVVAAVVARDVERAPVQREGILGAAFVLGEVALLQEVGGELAAVAERRGEGLVLAQVVVRLRRVAHAPVADRDVEQ